MIPSRLSEKLLLHETLMHTIVFLAEANELYFSFFIDTVNLMVIKPVYQKVRKTFSETTDLKSIVPKD